MVAYRNVCAREIAGLGNAGIARNHNRCFTNTVSLSLHDAFFNLSRLPYRPMAGAAHVSGAFAFASMSFGITFKRSKPVVIERYRRIDSGESRRIFTASFYIELVVETFLGEITLFVGHPIVEPAMRLNHKFRHRCLPQLFYLPC